jgi:nucleotide-binding universal stress UspA family protein
VCGSVDVVTAESTRGTLLCAVTAGEESGHAVELGLALSERLGLRLVLAHAVPNANGRNHRTAAQERSSREHGRAEQRLARVAGEHGVGNHVERRVALGDPAALLGRIAAEEAADIVVVGAAERGWRRRLDFGLARDLETETSSPVVIALPRRGRTRWNGHGG